MIISGLPEMSSGSLDERRDHDQKAVDEVLDVIGVVKEGRAFRLTRIGKPQSQRPRLLKAEFKSLSIKNEILRKAKALRKSKGSADVYINEDRTPMQQLEWYKLRQKLKHRKELGEDVVIYRNNVMLRDEVQGFRREF